MKGYTFITLLFVIIGLNTEAQDFNRPVPPGFPQYEFQDYAQNLDGYFVFTTFLLTNTPPPPQPPNAGIIDSQGYLIWYMNRETLGFSDFKFNPTAGVYSCHEYNSFSNNFFITLNTDLEILDTLYYQGSGPSDGHDLLIEDDLSYWIAGYRDTVMDLSAYIFNGNPGSQTAPLRGCELQHYDAGHNLIFSWNSNDYIHPSEAYEAYGYTGFGTFDYAHFNSIASDHDGHLLVSFRHLNSVYKINSETGEIIWRLGGKSSSFLFQDNDFFSGQHHARRISNGNMTLFDNGNMSPEPKRSRAVEYSLDTINWIATKVDEFSHNPPVFARGMGSYQKRNDGLRLINYAWIYRPLPSLLLLDEFSNLMAEIIYQDSVMSYRAFYQDLPYIPERPEVSCYNNDETITLNGPPGYTDYQWSTGETTASITMSNPGIYMLWVNHGEGMIGSEPVVIESFAEACTTTSVEDSQPSLQKEVIMIYDLMGRQPEEVMPMMPYIYLYSDGTSEIKTIFNQ